MRRRWRPNVAGSTLGALRTLLQSVIFPAPVWRLDENVTVVTVICLTTRIIAAKGEIYMLRPLILAASLALSASAASAGEAGKIIFVAGSVQVDGKAAALNGAVNEGEMLATGKDGYLYIRTPDNGLFILRPNSKGRIATYQIDKQNPANTRVKLELLSGVARSQSGEAVKLARQNFRFNTPVAAIGVRGTDFTVFTDQETSRVTVLSGGITVSGFAGSCSPDGSGPCEGAAARELRATQRGLQLQVQKGQATPQLLQGGSSLAPDVVAPPRPDEPKSGNSSTDVNLDPKKDANLQQAAKDNNQTPPPKPVDPGPIVTVPPEVTVEPPAAQPVYRELSWGRWNALAGKPTTGLSKDGATRIAMNDQYVLFRENAGDKFETPERGSVSFTMADGDARVKQRSNGQVSVATLHNGTLSFDFGKSSFTTSMDLKTSQGETFNLGATGYVQRDGLFYARDLARPGGNMALTGVLKDLSGAQYLFEGALGTDRAITGATSWKK